MLQKSNFKKINIVKYHLEDISSFPLRQEDITLLTTIGLPIINNGYYNFFPTTKIEEVSIDGNKYLIIGSPYEDECDPKILLNPVERTLWFYFPFAFTVGINKSPFCFLNESIESFLLFQCEVGTFVDSVFFSNKEIDFDTVEKMFQNLYCTFRANGLERLSIDYPNKEFYWKTKIYDIKRDIEEKYERHICFDFFLSQ